METFDQICSLALEPVVGLFRDYLQTLGFLDAFENIQQNIIFFDPFLPCYIDPLSNFHVFHIDALLKQSTNIK